MQKSIESCTTERDITATQREIHMNDTHLSASVTENIGRTTAQYRTHMIAALIGVLREGRKRFDSFELLDGETAVGHGSQRPEDNAFVLMFCRPGEHGPDTWVVKGKRVHGVAFLRLYILFSGPMILITHAGKTIEFHSMEQARLGQEIRLLFSKEGYPLR